MAAGVQIDDVVCYAEKSSTSVLIRQRSYRI